MNIYVYAYIYVLVFLCFLIIFSLHDLNDKKMTKCFRCPKAFGYTFRYYPRCFLKQNQLKKKKLPTQTFFVQYSNCAGKDIFFF